MLQRYGSLSGKLHMIELEKDPAAHGLGIRLAGNEEGSRARMSVYVEGIDPNGPAGLDGRVHVGDELLEVRSIEMGNKFNWDEQMVWILERVLLSQKRTVAGAQET